MIIHDKYIINSYLYSKWLNPQNELLPPLLGSQAESSRQVWEMEFVLDEIRQEKVSSVFLLRQESISFLCINTQICVKLRQKSKHFIKSCLL